MSNHGIPESALDKHIAILGKTGSGKSNLAKLITEDLLTRKSRVCVIDPTGTWWGMRLMADGKNPSGHSCVIFGGQHGDLPLSGSHGEAIAKVVSTTSTPAIIDTRALTATERTRFFTDFAETLRGANRGELTLIIDEAHLFMPQAGSGAGKASTAMLHAGNNLVSLGRGVGLRIILVCQRPTKIHKDALTQVETLVSMRFTGPQDQRAIGEWVEDATGDDFDPTQLRHLPVGDAWIWYPEQDYLERVHTPLASTYDSGHTRSQKMPDLPKIDVAAIEALLKQDASGTNTEDPKALRRRITELEQELRQQRSRAIDEDEIDRRVNAKLTVERARLETEMRELVDGLSGEIDRFGKKLEGLRPKTERSFEDKSAAKPDADANRNGTKKGMNSTSELTGPQQRILTALGWLEDLELADCANRVQVAFLSRYKPKGGAFNNVLGSLRSRGLVDYPRSGEVELTKEGRKYVPSLEKPLTTSDLQDAVMARLSEPQRRVLRPLISAFPDPIDVDELARVSGYEKGGGAFNNTRGSLRSLGLIEYPRAKQVAAREVLFLERIRYA